MLLLCGRCCSNFAPSRKTASVKSEAVLDTAQQCGGIFVKQFCIEKGLTERSFYARRKRLQESGPVRFAWWRGARDCRAARRSRSWNWFWRPAGGCASALVWITGRDWPYKSATRTRLRIRNDKSACRRPVSEECDRDGIRNRRFLHCAWVTFSTVRRIVKHLGYRRKRMRSPSTIHSSPSGLRSANAAAILLTYATTLALSWFLSRSTMMPAY